MRVTAVQLGDKWAADMGISCAEITSVVLGRCWQSFQAKLFELVDVMSASTPVGGRSSSDVEGNGVSDTLSAAS